MVLQGNWFDGKTSASVPVDVSIDGAGVISVVDANDHRLLQQVPFVQLRVTSRLGSTPRYVYFPDGEKLETKEHALIDQWLVQFHPAVINNLAYRLESHSYFVAVTLGLVVFFTWTMVIWGFPVASRFIAYKLPASVMDRAATETLQFLDKTELKPTQLDDATRDRVLKHFASIIAQNKNLNINVLFRSGGALGANAFALPDGTVIVTDEIIKLAKNDDELLAVLAHEVGHVKFRHSLRAAIQGSVISFGVVMLTGDLSAASNMLAVLPVIITNSSYSRDFEREADDNSLVFLDANHIPRHYFVDLMERLTYRAECVHLLNTKYMAHNGKSSHARVEKVAVAKVGATVIDQSVSSAKSNEEMTNIPIKNQSSGAESEQTEFDDDNFDFDAHRQECDKLIAENKTDLSHSKLLGFFASHPETDERTAKFKMQPASTNKLDAKP